MQDPYVNTYKVHNPTSLSDPAPDAQPDKKPCEGTPAHRLADHSRSSIASVALHAAASNLTCCAFTVPNDTVHVELRTITFPGEWAREGVAEVCHDPSQDGHIVQDDHVTIVDEREAYAFEPLLDMVVGNCWAAAVGLTDGNLERETWDSEEEECNKVRDLCDDMGQNGSSFDRL